MKKVTKKVATKKTATTKVEAKLSHEEFINKAIVSLRKGSYKGIHSVYSGFNEAFKKYYVGENPVEVTNKLAGDGKLVIKPCKGGVMLYRPTDATSFVSGGDAALSKILGK